MVEIVKHSGRLDCSGCHRRREVWFVMPRGSTQSLAELCAECLRALEAEIAAKLKREG